ncbi:hypothetical protein LSAT2_029039 [Lamellibrachia satsuma]|nr:hypothetical protein LSAT2_029039 [Lamellibrachia satsuma]
MAVTQPCNLPTPAKLVCSKILLYQPGDECPRQIQVLLKLNIDAAEVQEEDADMVEVYLLFCNHILFLFEEVVKKLERNDTTCVDLSPIMMSFKDKMTQRREYGFYGYITRVKLQCL